MFGIGMMELILIAVVALVVVGPQKLPDLMKQMGKFFVQIRQMSYEVRDSVENVIHDAEQEIEKEREQKAFRNAKATKQPREDITQANAQELDVQHDQQTGTQNPAPYRTSQESFDSKPGAKVSTGFDFETKPEPSHPPSSQNHE